MAAHPPGPPGPGVVLTATAGGTRSTRRLVRPEEGRLVAGVAIGLAEHLGWPVWLVRLLFVVLSVGGGLGVLLYAGYWLSVPLAPSAASQTATVPTDPLSPDEPDRNREARGAVAEMTPLLAVGAVLVGVVLLASAAGWDGASGVVVPVVVAGIGAAVLWRTADDAQRSRWISGAGVATRGNAWIWTLVGSLLLLGGIGAALVGRTGLGDALRGLAIGLVLLAGIAVVTLPWVLSQTRALAEERRARIRSEERAEIAARVHDSVLQTLGLIRRNADSPRDVLRLARAEERALRAWLYEPTGDAQVSLRAALEQVAADVEVRYGVAVELVCVGEAEPGPRLDALVSATRESMVNAAKHSGVTADAGELLVSVYAEVGERGVEVFVRDRGVGFDPASVPADRMGLRESVIGRMQRVGGSARVRSAPGEGTEVVLELPC